MAVASILAKVGADLDGTIEKVTNPCPVVPLLGGRNPILGSVGGEPASDHK